MQQHLPLACLPIPCRASAGGCCGGMQVCCAARQPLAVFTAALDLWACRMQRGLAPSVGMHAHIHNSSAGGCTFTNLQQQQDKQLQRRWLRVQYGMGAAADCEPKAWQLCTYTTAAEVRTCHNTATHARGSACGATPAEGVQSMRSTARHTMGPHEPKRVCTGAASMPAAWLLLLRNMCRYVVQAMSVAGHRLCLCGGVRSLLCAHSDRSRGVQLPYTMCSIRCAGQVCSAKASMRPRYKACYGECLWHGGRRAAL
ncbi:hypothetical protein COO60DRAFT_23142 [Scenedesmus sp. NREL 46B-D3]|nr:hypothetical protein COO60DRAFT_23142 [Scenedesmus sp. NREL 46B-D3]